MAILSMTTRLLIPLNAHPTHPPTHPPHPLTHGMTSRQLPYLARGLSCCHDYRTQICHGTQICHIIRFRVLVPRVGSVCCFRLLLPCVGYHWGTASLLTVTRSTENRRKTVGSKPVPAEQSQKETDENGSVCWMSWISWMCLMSSGSRSGS